MKAFEIPAAEVKQSVTKKPSFLPGDPGSGWKWEFFKSCTDCIEHQGPDWSIEIQMAPRLDAMPAGLFSVSSGSSSWISIISAANNLFNESQSTKWHLCGLRETFGHVLQYLNTFTKTG